VDSLFGKQKFRYPEAGYIESLIVLSIINNTIMKSKTSIFWGMTAQRFGIILFLLCIIPFGANAQIQENSLRQGELSFSISTYKTDTLSVGVKEAIHLIISASTKEITDVERIYIRVINPLTEENLLVKTIDRAQITDEKAVSENSLAASSYICKEYFSLDVGTFKKGEYVVYVKVKDRQNKVYFNRQKITI
jgi:hypothetical protein